MKYQVYTEDGVICVYLDDHELLLHISTDEFREFCSEISYHGMRIEAKRRAEKRDAKAAKAGK